MLLHEPANVAFDLRNVLHVVEQMPQLEAEQFDFQRHVQHAHREHTVVTLKRSKNPNIFFGDRWLKSQSGMSFFLELRAI